MITTEDIPHDLDGDVLRAMRAGGDRLTKARDIDFSVIFADEQSAVAFCDKVQAVGLHSRYESIESDDRFAWDVTVTKNMLPLHADISALENYLGDLAATLSGRTDGWGCLKVEDMASG